MKKKLGTALLLSMALSVSGAAVAQADDIPAESNNDNSDNGTDGTDGANSDTDQADSKSEDKETKVVVTEEKSAEEIVTEKTDGDKTVEEKHTVEEKTSENTHEYVDVESKEVVAGGTVTDSKKEVSEDGSTTTTTETFDDGSKIQTVVTVETSQSDPEKIKGENGEDITRTTETTKTKTDIKGATETTTETTTQTGINTEVVTNVEIQNPDGTTVQNTTTVENVVERGEDGSINLVTYETDKDGSKKKTGEEGLTVKENEWSEADNSGEKTQKVDVYNQNGEVIYSYNNTEKTTEKDGVTTTEKKNENLDGSGTVTTITKDESGNYGDHTVSADTVLDDASKADPQTGKYTDTETTVKDVNTTVEVNRTTTVEGNFIADFKNGSDDKGVTKDGVTTFEKVIEKGNIVTTIKTVISTDKNGNAAVRQNVITKETIKEPEFVTNYAEGAESFEEDGKTVYVKTIETKSNNKTTVKVIRTEVIKNSDGQVEDVKQTVDQTVSTTSGKVNNNYNETLKSERAIENGKEVVYEKKITNNDGSLTTLTTTETWEKDGENYKLVSVSQTSETKKESGSLVYDENVYKDQATESEDQGRPVFDKDITSDNKDIHIKTVETKDDNGRVIAVEQFVTTTTTSGDALLDDDYKPENIKPEEDDVNHTLTYVKEYIDTNGSKKTLTTVETISNDRVIQIEQTLKTVNPVSQEALESLLVKDYKTDNKVESADKKTITYTKINGNEKITTIETWDFCGKDKILVDVIQTKEVADATYGTLASDYKEGENVTSEGNKEGGQITYTKLIKDEDDSIVSTIVTVETYENGHLVSVVQSVDNGYIEDYKDNGDEGKLLADGNIKFVKTVAEDDGKEKKITTICNSEGKVLKQEIEVSVSGGENVRIDILDNLADPVLPQGGWSEPKDKTEDGKIIHTVTNYSSYEWTEIKTLDGEVISKTLVNKKDNNTTLSKLSVSYENGKVVSRTYVEYNGDETITYEKIYDGDKILSQTITKVIDNASVKKTISTIIDEEGNVVSQKETGTTSSGEMQLGLFERSEIDISEYDNVPGTDNKYSKTYTDEKGTTHAQTVEFVYENGELKKAIITNTLTDKDNNTKVETIEIENFYVYGIVDPGLIDNVYVDGNRATSSNETNVKNFINKTNVTKNFDVYANVWDLHCSHIEGNFCVNTLLTTYGLDGIKNENFLLNIGTPYSESTYCYFGDENSSYRYYDKGRHGWVTVNLTNIYYTKDKDGKLEGFATEEVIFNGNVESSKQIKVNFTTNSVNGTEQRHTLIYGTNDYYYEDQKLCAINKDQILNSQDSTVEMNNGEKIDVAQLRNELAIQNNMNLIATAGSSLIDEDNYLSGESSCNTIQRYVNDINEGIISKGSILVVNADVDVLNYKSNTLSFEKVMDSFVQATTNKNISLLLNLVVGENVNEVIVSEVMSTQHFGPHIGSIFYNFGNYDGKIQLDKQFFGTIVAPNASVWTNNSMNAKVIANYLYQKDELHQPKAPLCNKRVLTTIVTTKDWPVFGIETYNTYSSYNKQVEDAHVSGTSSENTISQTKDYSSEHKNKTIEYSSDGGNISYEYSHHDPSINYTYDNSAINTLINSVTTTEKVDYKPESVSKDKTTVHKFSGSKTEKVVKKTDTWSKKPTPPGPTPGPNGNGGGGGGRTGRTTTPNTVIPDVDVPLAVLGAYEELPDQPIPLAVLPMTGDMGEAGRSMDRAIILALVGATMTALGMKKKEEEY